MVLKHVEWNKPRHIGYEDRTQLRLCPEPVGKLVRVSCLLATNKQTLHFLRTPCQELVSKSVTLPCKRSLGKPVHVCVHTQECGQPITLHSSRLWPEKFPIRIQFSASLAPANCNRFNHSINQIYRARDRINITTSCVLTAKDKFKEQ